MSSRDVAEYAADESPLARWAGAIVAETLAAVGVEPAPTCVLMSGDHVLRHMHWVGLCCPSWIVLNGQALGLVSDAAVPTGATAEFARLVLIHEAAHKIQAWPSRAHGSAWRSACRRLQRALRLSPPSPLPADPRCKRWPHAHILAEPVSFAHRRHRRSHRSAAPILRLLPHLAAVVLSAFVAVLRSRLIAAHRRIGRLARLARLDPRRFMHHHNDTTRATLAMLAAL